MLEFMVIALPRSGTTWAAHWLGSKHDPLWESHFEEWDAAGWNSVSCTGIWRWPDWLNKHPARKLFLHRDLSEIKASLRKDNLPCQITADDAENLFQLEGMHSDWRGLFDPVTARKIWQHLRPTIPFDEGRHRELTEIKIQPNRDRIRIDQALQRRLVLSLSTK